MVGPTSLALRSQMVNRSSFQPGFLQSVIQLPRKPGTSTPLRQTNHAEKMTRAITRLAFVLVAEGDHFGSCGTQPKTSFREWLNVHDRTSNTKAWVYHEQCLFQNSLGYVDMSVKTAWAGKCLRYDHKLSSNTYRTPRWANRTPHSKHTRCLFLPLPCSIVCFARNLRYIQNPDGCVPFLVYMCCFMRFITV